MAGSPVFVPPEIYRSKLPKLATVFFALGAVLGLPGMVLLFNGEYQNFLLQDLYLGGVVEASAAKTWHFLGNAVSVIHFLWCAALASGLLLAWKVAFHKGFQVLITTLHWLLYGLYGAGILALGTLIFKLIRYIIVVAGINGGSYLLYSMLISEGLMVALAWLVFTLLRRFLNTSLDVTASMGYTISSGKLDSHSISSFPSLGLIILAVVCLVLSINHVYTLTIIDSFPQDYYKILVAERPAQYLAAASCVLCATGNVLMSVYLRQYKRKDERFRYSLRKELMADIRK